jgi:hypothetical protein
MPDPASLTAVLADRDPRLGADTFGWQLPFDRTPPSEDPSIFPPGVFALLDGMLNPEDPEGDEFARYPSADAAEAAPARAVARLGVARGRPPHSSRG